MNSQTHLMLSLTAETVQKKVQWEEGIFHWWTKWGQFPQLTPSLKEKLEGSSLPAAVKLIFSPNKMHMYHTGTIFTIALLSALYHEIKPELFFFKNSNSEQRQD